MSTTPVPGGPEDHQNIEPHSNGSHEVPAVGANEQVGKRRRMVNATIRALTAGKNVLTGNKELAPGSGNAEALGKIEGEEYVIWDGQMTMLSIGGELSVRILFGMMSGAMAFSETLVNDPELQSLVHSAVVVLIVLVTAAIVAITSLHFIKDSILYYQAHPEEGLINTRIGINLGSVAVDVGSLVGGAVLPNPRILKLFFKGGKLGKAAALSERAEGVVADVLERECHSGIAAAHRKSMMASISLGLLGGASGLSIGDTESLMNMGRELLLYCGIVKIAAMFNAKSQQVINATYSKRFAEATEQMIAELEKISEFGNVRETIQEQMLTRAQEGKEMNEIEIMASVLGSILNRLKTLLSDGAWQAGFAGQEVEEGEAAFVFTDIKGFSSYTVRLKKRLFPILNRYFDLNIGIFRKFKGDIDKLIGDAIFAKFPDPNDAFDAVVEMIQMEQNEETAITFPLDDPYTIEERESEGFVDDETIPEGYNGEIGWFKTRIGMHIGPYTRGSAGAKGRRENSHFGDTINMTSRLEPLGDVYGVQLNISGDVYNLLTEDRRLMCRLIDRIAVKGREEEPFLLYTVDFDETVRTNEAFRNAFTKARRAYLEGNWENAYELLHEADELYPYEDSTDGPTQCLIKRIMASREEDLEMLKKMKIRSFLNEKEYTEKVQKAMQAAYEPPENFIFIGMGDHQEGSRERGTAARLQKMEGYWRFSTKS